GWTARRDSSWRPRRESCVAPGSCPRILRGCRLAHPHREHVAGGGMQDGVLGKIQQDRQAVALTAAEHDQIDFALARDTHDLRLDVAGFDAVRGAWKAELLCQCGNTLTGPRQQLVFDA